MYSDFRSEQPAKAEKIRALLSESEIFLDKPMMQALNLALEDPLLFTHYWLNKDAMARYFGAWANNNAQADLESFWAVMEDFADTTPLGQRIDVPARIVLGKHDRIIDMQAELSACEWLFPKAQIHMFDESAHFPHLEEPERFLDVMLGSPTARAELFALPAQLA